MSLSMYPLGGRPADPALLPAPDKTQDFNLMITITLLYLIIRITFYIWKKMNERYYSGQSQYLSKVGDFVNIVDQVETDADQYDDHEDKGILFIKRAGDGVGITTVKRRSAFHRFFLRKLRENHHVDDYPNTSGNRRILKKRLVSLFREHCKGLRTKDIEDNSNLIIESFFVPNRIDLDVVALRNSYVVNERINQYQGGNLLWFDFQWWLSGYTRWLRSGRAVGPPTGNPLA